MGLCGNFAWFSCKKQTNLFVLEAPEEIIADEVFWQLQVLILHIIFHRFRHSSQKHIMVCIGIVIRLHPPWHFTSSVKNWRCLAVSSFGFAVNWLCFAVSLLSFSRELRLSCREFALPSCKFCFCHDTCGPPHQPTSHTRNKEIL